jgi:hypothetical protein
MLNNIKPDKLLLIIYKNRKLNTVCNILGINYSHVFNIVKSKQNIGNNLKKKLSPIIHFNLWD